MSVKALWARVSPEECLTLSDDVLASLYLEVSQGFYPESIWDGTRLRARRAAHKLDDVGLYGRLQRVSPEGLQNVTVPLGRGKLYTNALRAHTKSEIVALVGDTPSYVKIERSRTGELHGHLVTDARLSVSGYYSAPIASLAGFAAYLSKPADARACRWRDPKTGLWCNPTQQDKDAATAEWLRARAEAALAGGKHLASMTFPHKIPQNRSLQG